MKLKEIGIIVGLDNQTRKTFFGQQVECPFCGQKEEAPLGLLHNDKLGNVNCWYCKHNYLVLQLLDISGVITSYIWGGY